MIIIYENTINLQMYFMMTCFYRWLNLHLQMPFCMQRQDYHLLLSQATLPVKLVKAFLVGDVMAGKTTIKKALTMVRTYGSFLYWLLHVQKKSKAFRLPLSLNIPKGKPLFHLIVSDVWCRKELLIFFFLKT